MKWTFFPWRRLRASYFQESSARKRKRTAYPFVEELEPRKLPSTITLGLYNDTSGGSAITNDARLTGTLSDYPNSTANKTVTFSGGVTGSTTSNSNFQSTYVYTPTLSGDGTYSAIVAKFTNHSNQTVSSSSFSFTYDTTAPTVTLTAPSSSNTGAFQVTVSGTDANGLPNGTTVYLDVDLNNNGSFTDAGEQGYTTSTLTGGAATFTVSPSLSPGTYPIRARLADKAGNIGTSSTATVVVSSSPSTWAITGQQRLNDPEQATSLPFGLVTVYPNTGTIQVVHPLDFDLSPGASVGGNPALVYDSATVNLSPILEASLTSDPAGSVPSEIDVQLTWNNGTPQSWVTFSTTGHSAGDTYLLAVQEATVTGTNAYPWSLYVRSKFSSAAPIDRVVSGTAYVVDNGGNNPFLTGWSIAGVDTLVSVSGGMLWVYGAGGTRFFSGSGGTYISPANDFGTLVKNGNGNYTYTDKNQWVENFNSSGQETSLVSPDSITITYTYSSGRLNTVQAPDGGVATLSYVQDMHSVYRLSSISEPGNNNEVIGTNGYGELLGLTDPAGNGESFTYGSSGGLSNLTLSPMNETITYNATTGLVSSLDRGLGSTLNLAPAASQGLATSPALNSPALAVVTDALSHLTTYTLDGEARITKLQTPDGATSNWTRDSEGQVTVVTDPLGNTETYTYS
jgi:YD repeat-containing protein